MQKYTKKPKYIQHDDPEIMIPQHITRIALFSCQMMLINAYITYVYHYYLLATIELCLYITTVLHWRKIKYISLERQIDVCCMMTTVMYATYTSWCMPRIYTFIWITNLLGISSIFYINEKIFYYQVLHKPKLGIMDYAYFIYTKPNTIDREVAYYRNVITHAFFIHIWLCLVSIYCIVHNPL